SRSVFSPGFASMSNIPRDDPLKPAAFQGVGSRTVPQTQLRENQTDAAFIRGIPVSATPPTDKQTPVYNAATGMYEPNTVASAISGAPDQAFVYSSQELRAGSSSIYAAPSTSQNHAGDWVFNPGGFQRVEMMVIPRVGQ